MHQRAFDQLTRIVAQRKTRRVAVSHLTALAIGLLQFGSESHKATAQDLQLGTTCTSDAECAETEMCLPRLGHAQGICGQPWPYEDSVGVPQTQDSACTLVELNPGYPGYRGFVTGLFGQGEGACLEQLQRQIPWFDRDREDQENAAAASRLGLAGGPKDWVWENWLSIEAERGLPVTCYLCALERIAAGEQYQVAPTDPDDIRLIVGSFGSNELVFRVAARHGFEMWSMQYIAANDYQLRAVAWTVNAGRHVNARELQSIYDLIGEAVAAGQIPGQNSWRTAVAHGGYAPTPSQAAFEDQVFLLATPLEAHALGMNPNIAEGMLRTFNTFVVAEWASERANGSMRSLGEFIQDNYSEALGLS